MKNAPWWDWSDTAMSAVLKNPSSVNSFTVASRFLQYPRNTLSPLTWISPGSLWAVVTSRFDPSIVIRRTLTPGNAHPTLPSIRFSGSYPFDNAIPISVIPYRSSNTTPPVKFSHFRLMGEGKADDPQIWRRNFWHADATAENCAAANDSS